MPPIAPQSSRAGLITAVVIFVILFVTATIFAIYYGVDANRTHDELASKQTQMASVLPEGSLVNKATDELNEVKKSGKFPEINQSMPLITVAMKQRDVLARTIDPTAATAQQALDSQAKAIANATKKAQAAGVTLPPATNLVATINALGDAVAAKQAQITSMTNDIAAARQEAKAKTDELAAASAQMAEQMKQLRDATAQEVQAAASDREAKQKGVGDIETARAAERTVAQDALNKATTDAQTKGQQIARLQNELTALRERLGGQRISANEPIMRAADGTIVRVPGNNIVYISRGAADQIVPGMTFEVYDKNEGIPKVTDINSDKLPEGKASVEVIRVGPNSSECRVTHVKPGTTSLQEGDLIANLVYDPNVKYNFYVYGKFDIDQNGVPTAQETEVIKRLITQWGAKIQDQVNVDTDFVVMGSEPQIPQLRADEDPNDPLVKQAQQAAHDELNAYQDVLAKAKELHIPILNQNRFLYLIGYYNQITK